MGTTNVPCISAVQRVFFLQKSKMGKAPRMSRRDIGLRRYRCPQVLRFAASDPRSDNQNGPMVGGFIHSAVSPTRSDRWLSYLQSTQASHPFITVTGGNFAAANPRTRDHDTCFLRHPKQDEQGVRGANFQTRMKALEKSKS